MKKVAVYARVSTNSDDQKNSIENQKEYFEEKIKKNKEWKLYKIYADEGISGTSLKHREQFKLMYEDAKKGKFDIILTKEVCRFARNTVDTLEKTRELKKMGIEVRFTIDNISTFDSSGEFRLTIMAGLAQDESRRISERVQFGIIQTMKKGIVLGNKIYGYNYNKGVLTINKKEAKIVKEIFNMYLYQGMGTYKIAKELTSRNIPIRQNGDNINTYWRTSTILEILKNEKYVGDLIQRKSYTVNFLEHRTKKNNGEVDFIKHKEHHEAIIDRKTFDAVQEEIKKRSKVRNVNKEEFRNKHIMSGKIKCGICGKTYFVTSGKVRLDGTRRISWRCSTTHNFGKKHKYNDTIIGCSAPVINDNALKKAFKIALLRTGINKNSIQNKLIETFTELIGKYDDRIINNNEEALKKEKLIDAKNKLLNIYLDGIIPKKIYIEKNNEINEMLENIENDITQERKDEDNTELNSNEEERYDEVCNQLLEKIVVIDSNTVDVYIKNYKKPFRIDNIKYLDNDK